MRLNLPLLRNLDIVWVALIDTDMQNVDDDGCKPILLHAITELLQKLDTARQLENVSQYVHLGNYGFSFMGSG